MALIESPEAWMAVIALSPRSGPLDLDLDLLDSILGRGGRRRLGRSLRGERRALAAAFESAGAGRGPHNASPLGSVIVTVVLLNVALMCTTARLTLRRVFRFLALATAPVLLNQSDPINTLVVPGLFTIMPRVSGTRFRLGPGSVRARILRVFPCWSRRTGNVPASSGEQSGVATPDCRGPRPLKSRAAARSGGEKD